jgi:hypothetical protein
MIGERNFDCDWSLNTGNLVTRPLLPVVSVDDAINLPTLSSSGFTAIEQVYVHCTPVNFEKTLDFIRNSTRVAVIVLLVTRPTHPTPRLWSR